METFIHIIQQIIKPNKNIVNYILIKNNSKLIDTQNKYNFSSYVMDKYTSVDNNIYFYTYIQQLFNNYFTHDNYKKNKYIFFKHIIDNMFINDYNKKCIIDQFNIMQRTYFAFLKFAYIYKFNKYNYKNDTDLYLNSLVSTDKNTICLIHKNSKFLFNIYQLISLLITSLSKTELFYSEPVYCKNPYNNINFSYTNYINIYLFIKYNIITMPMLFYDFYKSNFNIRYFKKIYNYEINQYSIKHFIYNTNTDILFNISNYMLCNVSYNKLKIHHNINKNKVVSILKPYLVLYLNSIYLENVELKQFYNTKFLVKIYNFIYHNPNFGRQILKYNIFYKKYTEEYVYDHINYNKILVIHDIDTFNKIININYMTFFNVQELSRIIFSI
jgi:hypothetical protein